MAPPMCPDLVRVEPQSVETHLCCARSKHLQCECRGDVGERSVLFLEEANGALKNWAGVVI